MKPFDATKVEPSKAKAALWDAGIYPVRIVEQQEKRNRNGDGDVGHFTFESVGSKHKGERKMGYVTTDHDNPDYKVRGQQDMSALCHATGVMQLVDLQQLIGKMLCIQIDCEDATFKNDKGEKIDFQRNNVTGFLKYKASTQPQQQQAAPPPTPQPNAGFYDDSPISEDDSPISEDDIPF